MCFSKIFAQKNRVEGLDLLHEWQCLHCWEMPLHLVRLGNMPGAPTADLTNVATSFNCSCTICAEPQQRQFEQQFFVIALLCGLT